MTGAKEAIQMEVEHLRWEGYPIWTWRDGEVADARELEEKQ